MAQTKKKMTTKTGARQMNKGACAKVCKKKEAKVTAESNPFFLVMMSFFAGVLLFADALLILA